MTDLVIGLTRHELARRVALDLRNGWCINLGIGLPLLVPPYIPDGVEVLLHSEQGVLGIGAAVVPGEADADLTDAGKNYVTLEPGASAFDSALSFALARGGRLDVALLGALQVTPSGDLANWLVPGRNPGIGGAMDLAVGAQRVWVAMEHVDKAGRPKIVDECTLPLTARGAVDRIYTDLGVFFVETDGLVLVETAPGVDVPAIRERTEAPFTVRLGRDNRERQ